MKTQNQLHPLPGSIGFQCSVRASRHLAAGLLLLGSVWGATAADVKLTANDPAGSSSFNSAGRWSDGATPSAGNAYFTTNLVLRTPNPTTSGNSYVFGGDSLSIDPGGRFLAKIGNNVSGNTTVGTITVNHLILNGGVMDQAGANSDHSVLIVDGNVTVSAASLIGALGGTANGSSTFETMEFVAPISGSGALQVSGPNINGGGDTGLVKLSAPNPYSGTITVSAGNSDVIASAVDRILQLNHLNALSNATLNLNSVQASPVSFATAVNVGPFNVGALAGTSSQTLNDTVGSPVTLSVGGNNASTTYSGALTDSGNIVKVGSGTFTMTGVNTYFGSTTIEEGSLRLGDGGAGGLLPNGNILTINGNLTVDRNNTVVQGVDFSASPITGTGSFTQAGSGTTILNAANSYSGVTIVSAGKLVISSAQISAGGITVADGAALRISVSGSSQLSPASLTLGTSAGTTLELDGVGSTTVAPVNAGTVSAGGLVTVNITSGTFAAGSSYPLIHWTGSGPANASSFALGISPGLTANLSVSGSTLYLNVSAVSDIWAGLVDGNWDTTTANWIGHASIFANGDSVLFDDTAFNNFVTVNAPVQPGSVLFNNSESFPYTVASSGANNIGGTGGLTKINNGSLTLFGGANTYTGATEIDGGTLSVSTLANAGSPSDIGAASSDPGNLVLNNSTLQYTGGTTATDRGATLGSSGATVEIPGGVNLTDSGVIVGAGSLTKTGFGTLTLSGANTFSGGVTLNSGELDINFGGSSSANSAIGTGTLTISADAILDNTSGSDVTLLSNNPQVWNGNFIFGGFGNNLNLGAGSVSLPATRTVTVYGNTLTVGGTISGAGGLTKAGGGTLVLSGVNTFSGTLNLTEGTLAVGNDSALGTGQLNLNGGMVGAVFQSANGAAITITNDVNFGGSAGANIIFGGTGNLKFTDTAIANGSPKVLTINNPQTEFTGTLSGANARTVSGTGTLILSGANTYSGGTTINPGATLQLGNGGTNGSLSTSGVIQNDGTLIFNRSDALVQGVNFSSAPITGGGSVIQDGTGVTTLNAANSYFGSTLVNGGELFITPAYQAGGEVIVADDASFGVSATSVSSSARIGNLTLGNGGATALDFSYGLTENPTNAALVANSVTINGTSAIRIGGSFEVGTFPVLKYGSLSGTFANMVEGPRGVTATLFNNTSDHTIYVTVSSVGGGIVWTGTNSVSPNLWDLNTTTNWLTGGLPTDYIENVPPGDAVTFNDHGSGLVLLSNTVSPASVTVSNASKDYTFEGPGQISSLGGLTKAGAATLNLNVPTVFSGDTVLSNGAVNIRANQTFANLTGDSAITAPSSALTLTLNNHQDTAFGGNISGAISLIKSGDDVLTLTGSNNLSGNFFVSGGTLILDSASISVNDFSSIGRRDTDIGTLTLKGTASFIDNNDFNVGDVGQSIGTLNVQDSASLTMNAFYIGSANSAGSTASGTVNQSGGTVTVNTANFALGGRSENTSADGVGNYYLSGGTLNANGGIRLGAGGLGILTQTGGTINCIGDVNIARYAGGNGTYNFDGGTLHANRVSSSTSANATLNWNGGVLMPRQDSTTFLQQLSQANIRDGGAVIDTTNFNVTVIQPLLHSTIPGDDVIDGGLTKRGNGTLTLSGAGSSYTGPTVITGGMLSVVAGAVGSLNDVTVNNAALGMTMSYGLGVTYANNLTLTGNSALNINFDLVLGVPDTALNLSGSIASSGVTVINVSGYGLTVGQFTLVDYSGAPLADLSHFSLGALPVGVTASLVNNTGNTSIDLLVTDASVSSWIPLANSDSLGTSSFNAPGNWLDVTAPYAGNGYFTRAFTLRSPADANSYTFGGDILAIDAGGQLLLKGTGSQTITVNNLVLNGGLVVYGVSTTDNRSESLAGTMTLQSGTANTLAANGSANAAETLNVLASISGGGDLRINGISGDLGTILLAADNNYTGATTIAGGTLLINGANDSSAITVNADGTLGGTGLITAPITVDTAGNLAPGIPARGALTAAIGTLTAGNTIVNGTVLMKIDRELTPNSDKLVASSVVINPGATLTVTNIGSGDLVAGDTFTLFSAPVSGSFGTVNFPSLPDSSVMWTNRLAIDGTIAVIAGTAVNTNSPFLTNSVSGGRLTLSWPADHTGWTLQMQTNSLAKGLGTNWVDVPGSASTNKISIPITTTNPAVFYRLKL